jgi:hypothetical protein
LIIRWRVELDLEHATMVGPEAIDEILGWLRREYSHGACSIWSTEIEILSPKSYPSKWQEEDTILGDFLRTSQDHRKSLGQNLNTKPLLESETPATAVWQQLLVDDAPGVTSGALDRATLLGVDMLRGHKVDLNAPTRRFGGTRG